MRMRSVVWIVALAILSVGTESATARLFRRRCCCECPCAPPCAKPDGGSCTTPTDPKKPPPPKTRALPEISAVPPGLPKLEIPEAVRASREERAAGEQDHQRTRRFDDGRKRLLRRNADLDSRRRASRSCSVYWPVRPVGFFGSDGRMHAVATDRLIAADQAWVRLHSQPESFTAH